MHLWWALPAKASLQQLRPDSSRHRVLAQSSIISPPATRPCYVMISAMSGRTSLASLKTAASRKYLLSRKAWCVVPRSQPFSRFSQPSDQNLGNMMFPDERMQAKLELWGTLYNAAGQATQIQRTIRSGEMDLAAILRRARTAADARRRAVIVTSSLSRQAVADAFLAIQNGQRPAPSFVQLYWLLQSFFGACSEIGAIGMVVCQP